MTTAEELAAVKAELAATKAELAATRAELARIATQFAAYTDCPHDDAVWMHCQ